MRITVPALTACFLLVAQLPSARADSIVFKGEVLRGDSVVHLFEHDGRQFEFRLVPVGQGWQIWIGDGRSRERNFVRVATPPFRGVNPAVVQAWHFRNKDNSGPNLAGPGYVDAPQRERRFAFVLDRAGFQAAQQMLEILQWPEQWPKDQLAAARQRFEAIPKGTGQLRIEALELGNLVKDQEPTLERLAFRVRLNIP